MFDAVFILHMQMHILTEETNFPYGESLLFPVATLKSWGLRGKKHLHCPICIFC